MMSVIGKLKIELLLFLSSTHPSALKFLNVTCMTLNASICKTVICMNKMCFIKDDENNYVQANCELVLDILSHIKLL